MCRHWGVLARAASGTWARCPTALYATEGTRNRQDRYAYEAGRVDQIRSDGVGSHGAGGAALHGIAEASVAGEDDRSLGRSVRRVARSAVAANAGLLAAVRATTAAVGDVTAVTVRTAIACIVCKRYGRVRQ
jgi:hypothetical protein